jgi:GH35 family endo-1,4-beta-xylanase
MGPSLAALALSAAQPAVPSDARRSGPCADHAARHAQAATVLERRARAVKGRGDLAAARHLKRRSLWQSELARYYEEQARLRPLPRGAAITYRTLRRSRALRRSFLVSFEQLTPENEMKMERLQPAPGVFRFGEADRMVRFARKYCKRVRGHTLV